jgi:hypothetical protein
VPLVARSKMHSHGREAEAPDVQILDAHPAGEPNSHSSIILRPCRLDRGAKASHVGVQVPVGEAVDHGLGGLLESVPPWPAAGRRPRSYVRHHLGRPSVTPAKARRSARRPFTTSTWEIRLVISPLGVGLPQQIPSWPLASAPARASTVARSRPSTRR